MAGAPRSPVLRTPTGEVVDGRRLLAEAVGFGRALRRAGLTVDLGAAIDFGRALAVVDLASRDEVRDTGAAIFVRRRDDLPAYDAVFARFWRRRGRQLPVGRPDGAPPEQGGEPDATPGDRGEPAAQREATGTERAPGGVQVAGDGDGDEEVEGITISPEAYSAADVLRHRDFDRMSAAELRDAERLVDLLRPRLERRRTRRHELHPHGRRLAPRAMFRRNLATGGQFTNWVWRRQVREPRQIVILCDISGSMERHSRLLLRFVQALARVNEVKAESFVFGTRLTRVTRVMADRDRDRALARVADSVTDWAGGTRIGESFREFNHRWARRTLRTSGIVIVVSDGWDRGDPALVAAETARLRRNCHRLVWLNPLASAPGYQPLAAGMKAAYPYIDDFVPAGTIASLERLGEILAGASIGRRGAAQTHATTVAPSLGLAAPEPGPARPLGPGSDPAAARPLG